MHDVDMSNAAWSVIVKRFKPIDQSVSCQVIGQVAGRLSGLERERRESGQFR